MVRTQLHSDYILKLAIRSLLRIDSDCPCEETEANTFRSGNNLPSTPSLSASFHARPVRSGCTFILPLLRPGYSRLQHQQNGCVGMDATEVERGVAPYRETRAGRSFNPLAIRVGRGAAQSQSRYTADSDGTLPSQVAHGVAPRSASSVDRSRWATRGQCSRNEYQQGRLVAGVRAVLILHGGPAVCGSVGSREGYRLDTRDCRLAGRGGQDGSRRCLSIERAGDSCHQENLQSSSRVCFRLAVLPGKTLARVQVYQQAGRTTDRSVSFTGLYETHHCQSSSTQRVGGNGSTATRAFVARHYAAVLSRSCYLQRAASGGRVTEAEFRNSLKFLCGLPVGPDGEKSCGRIAPSSTHQSYLFTRKDFM